MLEAHERSISSPKQELRVDELRQQPIALGPVETPQALGLLRGQTEPGHFEILALHPPKHVVKRP